MQIPFNTISISCACLLVLFGFIINNEVDARALTRDAPNAALEHKRHEHSVLRKSSLHLKSNDHDEDARQYERAVKAVLDYAQYKLQQSKRDDETPAADSTNDDVANMRTEEGTDTAEAASPNGDWGTDNDDSNRWTESGTDTADGTDQGTNNNDTPHWNEASSRQLKQRQAKKQLSRNK